MKISIIVPIYGVENYIDACITSLIHQENCDIEIILVDDGSPDRCPAICDQYAEADARIKVIHKQNGGLSDARNAGLVLATGDYILFVDGDDFIHTTTCSLLAEVVKQNPDIDLISFSYNQIMESQISMVKTNHLTHQFRMVNGEEAYLAYLNLKGITHSSWSKLYRRSLFNQIQFPYGKLAEDFGTTYKILMQCKKVCILEDRLYYYVTRDNSIVQKKALQLTRDTVEFAKDKYKLEKEVYPQFKRDSSNAYVKCLLRAYARYQNETMPDEKEMKQLKVEILKVKLRNLSGFTLLARTIFQLQPKFVCRILSALGKAY